MLLPFGKRLLKACNISKLRRTLNYGFQRVDASCSQLSFRVSGLVQKRRRLKINGARKKLRVNTDVV